MNPTRRPRVRPLYFVQWDGEQAPGIGPAATGNPPCFARLRPIHSSNDTHRMILHLLRPAAEVLLPVSSRGSLPGSTGFQPATCNPAGKMPALPGGRPKAGIRREGGCESRHSFRAAGCVSLSSGGTGGARTVTEVAVGRAQAVGAEGVFGRRHGLTRVRFICRGPQGGGEKDQAQRVLSGGSSACVEPFAGGAPAGPGRSWYCNCRLAKAF